MSYRLWICQECDHEVLSDRRPLPIRWDDGHVCRFVEPEKPAYGFDAWLRMYTDASCEAEVHPSKIGFFRTMFEECSNGPWGPPDYLMDAKSGCTCEQLPEFDMDGTRFVGRCKWCEEHDDGHGPNQEWPPGAPVYR